MSDVNRSASELAQIAQEAMEAAKRAREEERAERERKKEQEREEKERVKAQRDKLRAQAVEEKQKAEESKLLYSKILKEFTPAFSSRYLYHFPLSGAGSTTQIWFIRPNPAENFELSMCSFNPQKDLGPVVHHLMSLGGEAKDALLEVVRTLEDLPTGKQGMGEAGALQLERQILRSCIEHISRGGVPENLLSNYPVSISNSKDVPTSCYYDLERITDGPTDAWDGFLDRSGPGKWIIPMFLYALVNGEHLGRQVLNLEGGAGAGKSIFGEAVKVLLGEKNCRSINDHTLTGQFGGSELLGKRALINADLKNLMLLRSELVHNITGRDTIRIEEKFQAPFSTRIHAMLLFMSNSPVRVFGEDNELSRLLPVKILPAEGRTAGILDEEWESKFLSQVFHVAFKGKELYEKYVTGSYIPLKTDLYTIDFSANYHSSYWSCMTILAGYEVTGDPSDFVEEKDYRSRLISALQDELKISGSKLDGISETFRRKMMSQPGVTYTEGKFFGVKDRGSAGAKKKVDALNSVSPQIVDEIKVEI